MCKARGQRFANGTSGTNTLNVSHEYQIELTLGDVDLLFQHPAGTDAGRKERLQVLGMLPRPLDHPECAACFQFAWQSYFKPLAGLLSDPTSRSGDEEADLRLKQWIEKFLVEEGALPGAGKFAKIRVAGGHMPIYPQNTLMAMFPGDEEYSDRAKPFNDYQLGANRFQVEQSYHDANPALGKIPLQVRVKRRASGSTGAWADVPGVKVWIQLAKPDPLPSYTAPASPDSEKHGVAGGFSFHKQAVAPGALGPTAAWLRTSVYDPNPGPAGDPQFGNVSRDMAGVRDAANHFGLFHEPASNRMTRVPAVAPGTGGKIKVRDKEGNRSEVEADKETVELTTAVDGTVKFLFAPSRIGGDRYRLRAFLAPQKIRGHKPRRGTTVAQTGTLIRWRTIRVSRQLFMPPPASLAEMPDYLKLSNGTFPDKIKSYACQPIEEFDLKGRMTRELARAYCELIVEQRALTRESIAPYGDDILAKAKELIEDYPAFNSAKNTSPSPHREPLPLDPNDATKTHYKTTLQSHKVAKGSVTIRPKGDDFTTSIVMDDRGTFDDLGKIPMAQPTTIDYDRGKVEVVFAHPQGTQEFEVCYMPDDYVDLDQLLVFPKKSPFLFNLRLPRDYNLRLEADSMKRGGALSKKKFSETTGDELARPNDAFGFIDSQSKGLVKGLLMQAAVMAIENNDGFYPGLVLLQADVLDNYFFLWPSGVQSGKGVGGGVYVLGKTDFQRLMVHEGGHSLYLEHAGTAPGAKPELHDKDDTCVMSYDVMDGDYCGKCNASLRGINILSRPARRKPAVIVPVPPLVAGTCGIQEILLASIGTSVMSMTSFRSNQVPVPTLADDSANRYCFAPLREEVWIAWTHVNPQLVAQSRLELFCTINGQRQCVWKKTFTWDNCPNDAETRFDGNLAFLDEAQDKTKNPGLRQVDLDFQKSRFPEAFPDACVTITHSPYELRVTTVSKDGSPAVPASAWMYFDVLVHKIRLEWGPESILDRSRTDVAQKFRAASIEREKKILQELVGGASLMEDGSAPGTGHDVQINVSMFDRSGFARWLDEMYGQGPRIPILAKALVRTSKRNEGADCIQALGRAQFLWEWVDNEGESLDDRVKRWLGDKNLATNPVSPITRHFIEEFIKGQQNATFPHHAYNASVTAGGKRGRARPKPVLSEKGSGPMPGPVFADDTKVEADHWWVTPCRKRDWAVLTPAKAGETIDAHSAILFQPSLIAGDTYKINVLVTYEKNRDGTLVLDQDLRAGAYYDLAADLRARGVALGSSRFFTVWRTTNATWYSTPAFTARDANAIATARGQMQRELGTLAIVDAKPWPELRGWLDEAIEHVIRTRLKIAAGALLLRSVFPRNPAPPRDADQAVDAKPSAQALADITDWFHRNPLFIVKTSVPAAGKELHGGTSHAWGVSLQKPNQYDDIEGEIVLSLNNTAFQNGEPFDAWTAPPLNGTVSAAAPADLTCWDLTVNPVTDATLRSREVKVRVPALHLETLLQFSEGVFRATRQVSDDRGTQILTWLRQVAADPGHHADQDLIVEVVGKRSDTRERQRVDNVADFLKLNVISRKQLFESFSNSYLKHAVRTSLAQFEFNTRTEVEQVFNYCFDKYIAALPNLDAVKKEGRVFFYHLRGMTVLNTDVTGQFELGRSTAELGYAQVLEPVRGGVNLRLTKDVTAVMVHEFGHALALAHAAPRVCETFPAGGAFDQHLAHDTCIMNYDADSTAFCAGCILTKRGYTWQKIVNNLGDPAADGWRDQCENLMRADIATRGAELGPKVRLAMFLADFKKDIPAATSVITQATPGLDALPNDKKVWLLRNLIVYYNRIEGNNNSSATAKAYLTQLLALTTLSYDVGDLIDVNNSLSIPPSKFTVWKNAD